MRFLTSCKFLASALAVAFLAVSPTTSAGPLLEGIMGGIKRDDLRTPAIPDAPLFSRCPAFYTAEDGCPIDTDALIKEINHRRLWESDPMACERLFWAFNDPTNDFFLVSQKEPRRRIVSDIRKVCACAEAMSDALNEFSTSSSTEGIASSLETIRNEAKSCSGVPTPYVEAKGILESYTCRLNDPPADACRSGYDMISRSLNSYQCTSTGGSYLGGGFGLCLPGFIPSVNTGGYVCTRSITLPITIGNHCTKGKLHTTNDSAQYCCVTPRSNLEGFERLPVEWHRPTFESPTNKIEVP